MYKEFLKLGKHSVIYGLSGILPKTIGFFLIPLYTRFLTPTDYGIVSMLALLTSFVGLILPLGLKLAFMRFYFEGESDREKNVIYSTSLIFVFMVALIAISILLISVDKVSMVLFNSDKYLFYTKISLATLFFAAVSIIPEQFFIVKQKSSFYLALSIASSLLSISLNIYFIVFLRLGVLGLLYGNLIGAMLYAVFTIVYTAIKTGLGFSFKWLRGMLKYGFPLIFSTILMFIYSFSDRFFLQRLSTLAAVGVYSLAFQFSEIVNYVASPFQTAQAPFVLQHYDEKHSKQMFSKLFTYSSLVFLFFSLGVSVFIKNIFSLMVGPEFFSAYMLVPILILAVLFRTSYYTLYIGITISKRTAFILYIYIGAALFNVIANFILVPRFGGVGAAFSRVATFLILAVSGYKISQRFFYIKYEFNRIVKMVIIALAVYFASLLMPIRPLIMSIALKGMMLFAFPLMLFVMKFFEKEEIEKIKALISIFKFQIEKQFYKKIKPEI